MRIVDSPTAGSAACGFDHHETKRADEEKGILGASAAPVSVLIVIPLSGPLPYNIDLPCARGTDLQ